jgi:hypothetical protein
MDAGQMICRQERRLAFRKRKMAVRKRRSTFRRLN